MIVVTGPVYFTTDIVTNTDNNMYWKIVSVYRFLLKDETYSLKDGDIFENLDCGRFIFKKVVVIKKKNSGVYLCECYDYTDLMKKL